MYYIYLVCLDLHSQIKEFQNGVRDEVKEKQRSLTKPGLLVSLHLDGETKVSQLHCCPLHLTGQQQVLRLQDQINKNEFEGEREEKKVRHKCRLD